MNTKPKIVLLVSGTADGGGSGGRKICEGVRDGTIDAEIVAIVSNHAQGGAWKCAQDFNIPFIHFPKPWSEEGYKEIFEKTQPQFVFQSGWLKKTKAYPENTYNVHPALLPLFGGDGMYGIHVHEAVIKAFHAGEVTESGFAMHKVNEEYDKGEIAFRFHTNIDAKFTPHDLGAHVNKFEHKYQPIITNLIVTGKIRFENAKMVAPEGYTVDWYEKDEGEGGRNEMLYKF